MATRVRSYSKINLGLAIGPVRDDGFHGLVTLYQTLDMHDLVTVTARLANETKISLTTNHPFVPRDGRNTAWKMVEKTLKRLGIAAEVMIDINKRLPVQGGMGAGSANAAAALIGLEKELGVVLPEADRLQVAAEVGSDVPLFLVGGAVAGTGRGEIVEAEMDMPRTCCLVVVPAVGVSTPAAFKAWDLLRAGEMVEAQKPMSEVPDMGHPMVAEGLTFPAKPDKFKQLSLAYASLAVKTADGKSGTSGIVRDSSSEKSLSASEDPAENALLALVRTGIGSDGASSLENDFEEVVFPQYPSLRTIKRELMGTDTDSAAWYAALSGSGSALFGLYGSEADAKAAQRRVQSADVGVQVQTFLTETLPRTDYWARMFAE
jgi:4-diphosphocytidyl-2-C-methyl-D-erythritol kinase